MSSFKQKVFQKKYEDFEVVEFMGISNIFKTIIVQQFS